MIASAARLESPPAATPGPVVLEVLSGSHAYGTAGPSSDRDWRGVYLLPDDAFLGLDRAQTTWEEKATDQVFWELGHFCRLLLKGNPNIVSILSSPPDVTVVELAPIAGLREMASAFVTQALRSAYVGWVHKELHEISRLHKGNAKRLSHVPRLIWEYEAAVLDGRVPVRLPDDKVEVVRAIKFGTISYEESSALVGDLLIRLEALDEQYGDSLPPPPVERVRDWLLGVRRKYGREGAGANGDFTGWPYGSPARTCPICNRRYQDSFDHAKDHGHWPPEED